MLQQNKSKLAKDRPGFVPDHIEPDEDEPIFADVNTAAAAGPSV